MVKFLGLILLATSTAAAVSFGEQRQQILNDGDSRDLFFAADASNSFDVDYVDHKLLRLDRPSEKGALRSALDKLLVEKLGLDVWAYGTDFVDVRVSPKEEILLQEGLNSLRVDLKSNTTKNSKHHHKHRDDKIRIRKTLISDLNALVKMERARLQQSDARMSKLSKEDSFNADKWFSDYHRFDDIRAFFEDLSQKYPELLTFVPSIGKTYLGEDIFALYVSSSKDKGNKPQFWFHSGDHAREWIGPATMQYFVHTSVTKYGKDKEATALLDSAEFIVVPLMNADGYKYTWDKSRLWRKNRRPIKNDIFGSVGVDLNRNWPAHWGEGGSSNSPYSDVYMGPTAGSEPEVKALMKFFTSANHTRLLGAIDFHSYSQLVLRPYGWTEDPAPDERLLKKAGDGIRDAIKATHGKKYTSQREIDLYAASGTASDWFYGGSISNAIWLMLYAYTIELRPSPDETWGNQGFILPPEQIIPTGEEIYSALTYFVKFAIENPLWVDGNKSH
ncbi:hypothetical protein HDU97_001330 [Phlyctochytrium planicorne]|nr:hypothetical protein HDU97_001330 [Phlyctochytrium planicorne]